MNTNFDVKENACDCGMQKINDTINNAKDEEIITDKINFSDADVNDLIHWIKCAKLSKKYDLMRVLLKDPETRYIIFEIQENTKYGK